MYEYTLRAYGGTARREETILSAKFVFSRKDFLNKQLDKEEYERRGEAVNCNSDLIKKYLTEKEGLTQDFEGIFSDEERHVVLSQFLLPFNLGFKIEVKRDGRCRLEEMFDIKGLNDFIVCGDRTKKPLLSKPIKK